MSATKTTTKPSASARALRHASRAASAPAPEAPTHPTPTPQPQASLLAVPEGNGAIDVDNATDVTIPTPTAQVERAHSVIDVDVPDVTTVHAERAPSIIDVDAATHPTKEKAAEVDSPVSAPASTAPAYVTSTTQTTPRENSFPPLPTPGVEIKSPAKKDKGKEKDMVAQSTPHTPPLATNADATHR
ncbi:hypothetical protein B0H19DRAFT_1075835 [Mycena capillaripes]|nr:hypothetical protein B0H19DRAFT_1075835 [Mycena capillaripes]